MEYIIPVLIVIGFCGYVLSGVIERAKHREPISDSQKQISDHYLHLLTQANARLDELTRQSANKVDIGLYKSREQELLTRHADSEMDKILLNDKLLEVQAEFDKIQSGQISKSVRLGQIAESVAPLLEQFPYDFKNAVPMFRPIDYVVFEPNEVIFVEYKTGVAGLSEKQRNIRDNVRAGRVRFEIHRMDETGYSVKE